MDNTGLSTTGKSELDVSQKPLVHHAHLYDGDLFGYCRLSTARNQRPVFTNDLYRWHFVAGLPQHLMLQSRRPLAACTNLGHKHLVPIIYIRMKIAHATLWRKEWSVAAAFQAVTVCSAVWCFFPSEINNGWNYTQSFTSALSTYRSASVCACTTGESSSSLVRARARSPSRRVTACLG